MRPWLALFPTLVLASSLGCQQLPEEPDDDGAGPGATQGADTGGGTLIPGDDTSADAETGGGSMSNCDPVTQIGCAAGEKCTATLSAGAILYTCVADPAGLDVNAPCQASHDDGVDGCPPTTVCLEDEAGQGVCVSLCEVDGDCTQAECLPARESDIPYCADDCSPFGSLCPAPLQCRRNGNRFSCAFIGTADIGGPGAACSIAEDAGCAPGLACLPGALVPDCATGNCCAPLCDLSEADPCGLPSTCNGILQGPAPGFEEIGACFVPS
ncbi:MAG: hypothetical protein K0V04_03710 [Deltaproteobacteria bacterium]|nr:hypothetical protein [Deltaproteobacteria bacterium]